MNSWRVCTGYFIRLQWHHALLKRNYSTNNSESWSSFNNVAKMLQQIANDQGLAYGELPTTQQLNELGHRSLVIAIRKKHGGFHNVATKLGYSKSMVNEKQVKNIKARATRRQRRQTRIEKLHRLY